MTIRPTRLALASALALLSIAPAATAQRGGRGGGGGMVGRPGGGGGGGGGFSRPAANFARPATPNFARPATPNFARPAAPNFARPAAPTFNRPNVNNFNRTNVNQNFNNFNRTNVNQNFNNFNRTNINQNFNRENVNRNMFNNTAYVNNFNGGGNYNRGNYGGYGQGYGGYGGGNRAWGGNGFYGSGLHGNSYYGYHSNWVNGSWGGNLYPGYGGYGYGYGGYGGYGPGGFGGYGGYGFGSGLGLGLGLGAGLGVASWGLGSLFNNYGYSQYSNPYYASAYSAQPASFVPQSLGYDYSMPLNLAAPPPDEAVLQSSASGLDSAREAFHAGDYAGALAQADQALRQTPNDPMLHEFRATCLFALRRYDEAAVPFYTVLSAGPGWDWTTLIGLYPDVETYTAQLRALEDYCNGNPRAASARFVLASLYLTQGSKDAAAERLRQIVAIQPQDKLSAQLLQALAAGGQPEPTANTNTNTNAAQAAPPQQPPAIAAGDAPPANPSPAQGATPPPLPKGPVPANLIGTWTASPNADVAITLTLADEKSFAWKVVEKGQAREFKGDATFENDVLALVAPQMPPMVAKATFKDPAHFNFKAVGTPGDDPGLNFAR